MHSVAIVHMLLSCNFYALVPPSNSPMLVLLFIVAPLTFLSLHFGCVLCGNILLFCRKLVPHPSCSPSQTRLTCNRISPSGFMVVSIHTCSLVTTQYTPYNLPVPLHHWLCLVFPSISPFSIVFSVVFRINMPLSSCQKQLFISLTPFPIVKHCFKVKNVCWLLKLVSPVSYEDFLFNLHLRALSALC